MIYYPLSILMMARIKEILIITDQYNHESYKTLLGDGTNLGIKLSYVVQEKPDGIGSAFILGKSFIADDSVALILGDNIFHGFDFSKVLNSKSSINKKGHEYSGIRFLILQGLGWLK